MPPDTKADEWGAFVEHAPQYPSPSMPRTAPLFGLRVAVKDNIAAAGLAWTCGMPLYADRKAASDAACVATLRAAGATIVGATATDAAGFGMMTPAVTNPLAPDLTAGGSSGGSAAAVAAGLADVALGTDTGGSVRVPAACCGIYGLKPTFSAISLDGVTPLSPSCDHVGLLAADLAILALTADVLLQRQISDALSRENRPRRIAFAPARLASAYPPVAAAIDRTLSWLGSRGHSLVEIELPDAETVAGLHGLIVCDEARRLWSKHWPSDAARFAETARRTLVYTDRIPASEIADARRSWPLLRETLARIFAGADVFVGPTIAVAPPRRGAAKVEFSGADVPVVFALLAETCTFNASGHPALAAPLPWLDGAVPFSLQIAAPHGREDAVLSLASELREMPSIA